MRSQTLIAMTVLLAVPASHAQEFMDYGTMPTIHEETRETTGIGSFHLRREGGERWRQAGQEAPREEWIAHADVYSMDDKLLGKIELRWPDATTKVVTYTVADTGKTYQVTGHDDGSPAAWLEFRDQSAGFDFKIYHVGPEADRTIHHPDDEAISSLKNAQAPRSQWLLEGISKDENKKMEDYQDLIGLIGMMVLEIETVFGIAPGQQRSLPPDLTPVELFPKFITCDEGFFPFCDFYSIAVGDGEVLFGGKTACCTEASQEADITCQIHTGTGCCANSFCHVTSLICAGYCACTVLGYLWGCENLCT